MTTLTAPAPPEARTKRPTVRAQFRPRTCTRQPLLVTHDDMVVLLNDDLRRERKAVLAYAVYADKLRAAGRNRLAAAVGERGRVEAGHELKLAQLVRDFGGADEAEVDELNAILNADRVARPEWTAETCQRLHDRARQLRTAGFPGYAKRVTRMLAEKRRSADLGDLVGG